MNLRQRKSNIALMLIVMVVLALPVASYAGLLSNLLGSKAKTTTTSTTTSTSTTTATGGTNQPWPAQPASPAARASGLTRFALGIGTSVAQPTPASALITLLAPALSPVLDLTNGLLTGVLNLVNNQVTDGSVHPRRGRHHQVLHQHRRQPGQRDQPRC